MKDLNGKVSDIKKAVKEFNDFVNSEDFHSDKVCNYEHDILTKAIKAFAPPDFWVRYDKVNQ
jgi:hypothetical protein